jgi:hypothetical protein
MATLQQLMDSRPEEYAGVAEQWRLSATSLGTVSTSFQSAVTLAESRWTGETKGYHSNAAKKLGDGIDEMARVLQNAAVVTNQASANLAALCDALRAEVGETRGELFLVDGTTGLVTLSEEQIAAAEDLGPEATPAQIAFLESVAITKTGVIQAAIVRANAADMDAAAQLMALRVSLEGRVPFQSSLTWPPEYKYDGQSGVYAQGNIGEDLNLAYCELNGESPVAAQVPITFGGQTMKADRIVALPPDGRLAVYEVKTNTADLSDPQQKTVLPRVKLGGATVGSDAVPGVPRGTVIAPGDVQVRVQRWDTGNLPPDVLRAMRSNSVSDIMSGRAGTALQQELRSWISDPANQVTSTL